MFKALRLAASSLCAWVLLFLPAAANVQTVFTSGKEYTFYCQSASAQAEIITCKPAFAAVYKYFLSDSLTGESTVYDKKEVSAASVIEEYQARLLFTETACGTVNYYCYSPALGEGVSIFGYSVNLHVAESEAQTAVGTPLIFGGF